MCPLVGYVASIGVDGGHFVGTISFKGEKEARVTIPVFTNCPDAKQPASITGGVETFVIKAWGKKRKNWSIIMCKPLFISVDVDKNKTN